VTMSKRAVLLPCLLLLASLALVGCGAGANAGENGQEAGGPSITVIGLDTMKFSPETITVKAGEPIKIVFKNGGFIPHDLITENGDRNARLANIGGGRQASGTFLAAEPGTYPFVCIQPGHKEAGMVGKIVVE
ncbi:MAG TPA: plastocyanin/azurin family copper-binding protein, partial [Chloroflexota bacterium]|nr:plastocyanin/azurin family copper-binding protein [Chloroflexota bacterium]